MLTKTKARKQAAKRNGTSLSVPDKLAERISAYEAVDEHRRKLIERDEANIRALVCVLKAALKERWNPFSSWPREAKELLQDPELYYI